MATAPTLTLCDDLVTLLTASWEPSEPSGVERHYFKRITDEAEAEGLADSLRLKDGERRVVIFPVSYSSAYENHAEDLYTHGIQVLVAERYTDAGDPSRDWIDERVNWTFTEIVQAFDFRDRPTFNPNVRTISQDVIICDVARLLSGGKLFWSVVNHVFEETRTA